MEEEEEGMERVRMDTPMAERRNPSRKLRRDSLETCSNSRNVMAEAVMADRLKSMN